MLLWWLVTALAAPVERPDAIGRADAALRELAPLTLPCELELAPERWHALRSGVAALDREAAASAGTATRLALLLRAAEGHGIKAAALYAACIPAFESAEAYRDTLHAWADDEREARLRGLHAAAKLLPQVTTVAWVRSDATWLTAELAWEVRSLDRECWSWRAVLKINTAFEAERLAEQEVEQLALSADWHPVAAELAGLGLLPSDCLPVDDRALLTRMSSGIVGTAQFEDWSTLPDAGWVRELATALHEDPDCPAEFREAWHHAADATRPGPGDMCGTALARAGQCGWTEPRAVSRPHRRHPTHLALPSSAGVRSLRVAFDEWAATVAERAPLQLRELPDVILDTQAAVRAAALAQSDPGEDAAPPVLRAELQVSLAAVLIQIERAIPRTGRRVGSDAHRRLLHDVVGALDAAYLLLSPSFRPGTLPERGDEPFREAALTALERANAQTPW